MLHVRTCTCNYNCAVEGMLFSTVTVSEEY